MNINEFSVQLNKMLWSDETLALIPDFGWNDGGCRSLMKAMTIWLGAENARPHQLVKSNHQFHAEHAFVQVGPWFLDADGVSSWLEMEHRWLYDERLPLVIIRPFDPETEPDHTNGDSPHYIEEKHIATLARMLDEHFDKTEVLSLLNSQSKKGA